MRPARTAGAAHAANQPATATAAGPRTATAAVARFLVKPATSAPAPPGYIRNEMVPRPPSTRTGRPARR